MDEPSPASRSDVQPHLAELLAMMLIEKNIIDRDELCEQIEGLASQRRSEGDNRIAANLATLAVSLRAISRK